MRHLVFPLTVVCFVEGMRKMSGPYATIKIVVGVLAAYWTVFFVGQAAFSWWTAKKNVGPNLKDILRDGVKIQRRMKAKIESVISVVTADNIPKERWRIADRVEFVEYVGEIGEWEGRVRAFIRGNKQWLGFSEEDFLSAIPNEIEIEIAAGGNPATWEELGRIYALILTHADFFVSELALREKQWLEKVASKGKDGEQ